jgi:hypothetical protein
LFIPSFMRANGHAIYFIKSVGLHASGGLARRFHGGSDPSVFYKDLTS